MRRRSGWRWRRGWVRGGTGFNVGAELRSSGSTGLTKSDDEAPFLTLNNFKASELRAKVKDPRAYVLLELLGSCVFWC